MAKKQSNKVATADQEVEGPPPESKVEQVKIIEYSDKIKKLLGIK